MDKQFVSTFLRKLNLIKPADRVRFYVNYLKTYKRRKHFFSENPGVKLPPPHYVYETFNLDYFAFYNDSIETAKWLLSFFQKHKTLQNVTIMDWGCGPGRIIRHMPYYTDATCSFYGCDYNKKYIDWCSKNIPGVKFLKNELAPPVALPDKSVDIIYGISIFTHLSEKMHTAWFDELMRLLRPGGILFITLHGNAFKSKLNEEERHRFENGRLVTKANTREGHRTFAAYQPESYIRELAEPHEILEHHPGDIANGKPQQDIWIIRKNE